MDVFVYGTLTEPARVADLLDSYVFVGAATLVGVHPVAGRYPTLAPGGETAGRLLRTDEIATLDEYEGVDTGMYHRIAVPTELSPSDTAGADTAQSTQQTTESAQSTAESAQPTAESAQSTPESTHPYPETAAVYVGDPERLDADVEWPGTGSFAERVNSYLTTSDVWVRVNPKNSV